jgi:nitroreductase
VKQKEIEMSVCEAILARRSVREYTSQVVDAKRIRSLIEAAVMAPIGQQYESRAFLIIQDAKLLKSISDVAKTKHAPSLMPTGKGQDAFSHPEVNIFHDANTLIVICANKSNDFSVADCWMAAENLMLAAQAIGLGTCVIGSALTELNDAERKVALGISHDYEAVAPIAVGYPESSVINSKRERPIILNWLEG